MFWRPPPGLAKNAFVGCVKGVSMSPDAFQSFIALGLGFAVAGAFASGFQLVTRQPASFRLLQASPYAAALAAVPLLYFAAPFIIMRNIVLTRGEASRRRFEFVMLATVIAGFWSLMSGTVVVMALQAIGFLAA
jgi:hypothetical protein